MQRHHINGRGEGKTTLDQVILLCGPVDQQGTCHYKAHHRKTEEFKNEMAAIASGDV